MIQLSILLASRHLRRMRSHRAEWRRSFCAALRAIWEVSRVALAFSPFVAFCFMGGSN